MAEDLLINWEKKSAEHQKLYKNFLQRVDKNKTLKRLQALHDEAFERINCLECGRCCKSHSPRFKTPDIKRISKYLGMKESVFIEAYLRIDSDGDYVNKKTPCQFLNADNTCQIYDERPSDCARYPYTDEDVLIKRPILTLKNTEVCPITYFVMEKLLDNK